MRSITLKIKIRFLKFLKFQPALRKSSPRRRLRAHLRFSVDRRSSSPPYCCRELFQGIDLDILELSKSYLFLFKDLVKFLNDILPSGSQQLFYQNESEKIHF